MLTLSLESLLTQNGVDTTDEPAIDAQLLTVIVPALLRDAVKLTLSSVGCNAALSLKNVPGLLQTVNSAVGEDDLQHTAACVFQCVGQFTDVIITAIEQMQDQKLG